MIAVLLKNYSTSTYHYSYGTYNDSWITEVIATLPISYSWGTFKLKLLYVPMYITIAWLLIIIVRLPINYSCVYVHIINEQRVNTKLEELPSIQALSVQPIERWTAPFA